MSSSVKPCHTFHIFATFSYLQGLFAPAVMSIIDEITHVQQFIMTQTSVGVDIDQIQGGQAAALRDKIARLPALTAQVATQLVQLIAGGPWTGSSRDQLMTAVNVRLSQHQPVTACGGRRRANQVLLNFQAYIPGSTIAILRSDASDMVKIKCLVELCVKLGLDCPSEKTTQHILSVFVALKGGAGLDAQLAYGYVMEFKKMLKVCFSSGAHTPSPLVTFPDNPKDLPAELYSDVYPQGNEPVDIGLTLVDVQGAMASVACRRTSKLVRSSTSSAIVPSQPVHGDAVQTMFSQLSQLFQNAMSPPGRRSPLNIQFLDQRANTSASCNHVAPATAGHMHALADISTPLQPAAPATLALPATAPPAPQAPLKIEAPMGPKTPQQAADALLQAIASRAHGDEEPERHASSSVRTTPMKRPAASNNNKKKQSCKKDSSHVSTPSKNSNHAAGNCKGKIPDAVRKKFKNGCSRCRFIKGCTPSCWTRRGYS